MAQPALRAGDLDRRIAIVRPTRVQDATGEAVATADAPVFEAWAKLMEQRLGEVFSGAAEQVQARTVFRIRFREGVSQSDVVVYGGARFGITGIQEFGRRVGLDLICERTGESA